MSRVKIYFLSTILLIVFLIGYFYVQNYFLRTNLDFSYCPKSRQLDNGKYYSEYFEDYILSIIFKDQKHGSYVDVGAGDPILKNATKYFYDLDWNGINIEPNNDFFERYKTLRNKDKNYKTAISSFSGESNAIIVNKQTNLWDRAISKAKSFLRKIESYISPSKTLNDILKTNKYNNFDFLKINAKFFETNILESIDLKLYRPKVIVVESLDTKNLTSNHLKWEDIIISNNYSFVMFDGLSRYYLDKNSINLKKNFVDAYNCINAINGRKNILLSKPIIAE